MQACHQAINDGEDLVHQWRLTQLTGPRVRPGLAAQTLPARPSASTRSLAPVRGGGQQAQGTGARDGLGRAGACRAWRTGGACGSGRC